MATGATPSIADVASAAQVSRRTIYMYFPTLEQLLLDATLGALSTETIDPVIGASGSGDAAASIEQLSRAVNNLSGSTMHLGRALIRLTVDAHEPRNGVPRRGYRRIEWIERTLESVRSRLTRKEFERLVSALSVLMGWEALVVLSDGLDEPPLHEKPTHPQVILADSCSPVQVVATPIVVSVAHDVVSPAGAT